MDAYRSTKATVNLGAIRRNTKRILEKYPGYQYYMAVVKADCYGYRGSQVIDAMLQAGVNSLAASLVEEGLYLRQLYPELPILLFTPAHPETLPLLAEKQLWTTVATQEQAEAAAQVPGLQILIRVNGGCDILGGPTTRVGFEKIWNTLRSGKCTLTGIYLHSYNAENPDDTMREYEKFEELTSGVDLSCLKIISISNSLTLPRYKKLPCCNACRIGNIVYNIESTDSSFEHTFQLTSQVLSVFSLNKGQSIAYSRAYTAIQDQERIAVIPIGFGDGFSKTNIGRDVFIHGQRFPIVAVTMDITLLKIDSTVKPNDTVYLIRDNHHLDEIASHIHGATEESICALNKRVYREYLDN